MTIEARLFEEGSDHAEAVELAAVTSVGDRSLLWVDMSPDDASLSELEGLGLAEAARELAAARDHAIAFYGDTIRLTVFGLQEGAQGLAPSRLALLLARNIVVSIHAAPIIGLEVPVSVMSQDPRFGRLDAGRFSGLLLEGVLGGFDDVVEALEREIDELDERALLRKSDEDLLRTMVDLRGRIAMLRRALSPQRPVLVALGTLVEDKPSPLGMPHPSLLAHLEWTMEGVERLREQMIGSFDILMTRTGQRTNDIVRTLTVVSAVLLPAVVIAGIMGMNFRPGFFDEPALFFVVVALMAAIAVATLFLARRLRWI